MFFVFITVHCSVIEMTPRSPGIIVRTKPGRISPDTIVTLLETMRLLERRNMIMI